MKLEDLSRARKARETISHYPIVIKKLDKFKPVSALF